VRRAGEGLASELEVQGLLWAVLPEERLQRSAALYLLAAGNARADRWDVTFTEPASYARFIAAVDQKLELYQPWTGLLTVDVLETEGVPVLRVVPGSPAALAGVQPGERVLALDGRPLATTAELLVGVAARKPGERLALRLRGPAGERELTLALGKTPREVPLDEPSLLYNKVMVDLRQELDGHPGSEAAAYARLNLALCAMRFGDYAAAHARLLEAKDELPERPGLSRGTALYYLGLAFERLGDRYRREAAEAYRAAAAARDATLLDNDGPLVAPLAARRAQR
jgi:tetratricopeptide (TPR) repeat protein